MTLHSSRDVPVLCAAQQITFPMPRNGSVFHFRGPFTDRDGIDDLAAGLSADRCMERAAHAPLAPQVLHQLLFQHAPRLEEQASVNGLVGHAPALVIGILCLSHPEICSGDQSNTSLLATIFRNLRWLARRHLLGRNPDPQASLSASWAR